MVHPQTMLLLCSSICMSYMDSSQDSLKTLFRNSNLSFGKHIPGHALMKNLLQNFDVDKKRNRVAYHVVDVIPTKDPNSRYRVVSKKSSEKKMDKTTSTTGLAWSSVSQNSSKHCSNDFGVPAKNMSRKKSHRKKIDITIETFDDTDKCPEIRSNKNIRSFIKDNTAIKEDNKSNITRPKHLKNCSRCKGVRQDTFVVEKNSGGSSGNVRCKEKSFVQRQVEKLNALYAVKAQAKQTIDIKRLGSRKFSYTNPIEVK